MHHPSRRVDRRSAHRGLYWTPRQLTSGLLLSATVVTVGSLVSCSTTDKVAPIDATAQTETTPPPVVAASSDAGESAARLDHCLRLLVAADELLSQTQTVQATFHKRERLGGVLEEQNVIDLRVRREPMAVYMRWQRPDEGREAIWRADANDGQIVVHPGGWKGRWVPVVKVDPFGARAASGSRRPINTSGPWHFNGRLIALVQSMQQSPAGTRVVNDQATLHGEPCERYTLVRSEPGSGHEMHKAVIWIEQDRLLPIGFDLYGWPAEGATEPPLEESYAFMHLNLNPTLDDSAFTAHKRSVLRR
ncbi:MAG TPA: DUF1571 domain-containing protein [Pirellulales bacterium]|nr:DUF1571 domain-containing protein [Pirellulales bacterium]